jgi:ferredoxin
MPAFRAWRGLTKTCNHMPIKKVWRDDGHNTCIACKICQSFAPRVFRVFDKMIVMPGVDYESHRQGILDAVENCPTGIIRVLIEEN